MAAPGARVHVPVAVACRVLGFSKQADYKWRKQPLSAREVEEAHLIQVLQRLHQEDPEAGYRYHADDMEDLEYLLTERRVWRLCRIAGIRSTITARKRKNTPPGPAAHDDLVNREFTASAPNRLWLMDITEHATREGKLFLCPVKDTFSNRIVGYCIDSRMKARIAVNAVMHRGQPRCVVVRSDRGSQLRSKAFLCSIKAHKLHGSRGQVGAAGDNAAMESFFALLQKNVLERQGWNTRQQHRLAIVGWIEGKYHRKRRQRTLGKLTPVEFETIMDPAAALAA